MLEACPLANGDRQEVLLLKSMHQHSRFPRFGKKFAIMVLTKNLPSVIIINVVKIPLIRGCSSVVERNLAKVDVARSNRVSRLTIKIHIKRFTKSPPS
jgi:hypothetical protein